MTRWSAPAYHCWTSFEDRGETPPTIRYRDMPELTKASFVIPSPDRPRPDAILALYVHGFPDRLRLGNTRYYKVRDWEMGVVLYAME